MATTLIIAKSYVVHFRKLTTLALLAALRLVGQGDGHLTGRTVVSDTAALKTDLHLLFLLGKITINARIHSLSLAGGTLLLWLVADRQLWAIPKAQPIVEFVAVSVSLLLVAVAVEASDATGSYITALGKITLLLLTIHALILVIFVHTSLGHNLYAPEQTGKRHRSDLPGGGGRCKGCASRHLS